MKIKIYVDWNNREVYDETSKEMEIQRLAKESKNDDYCFDDFLCDYCDRNLGRHERVELFKMSEEKRAEVLAEFEKECLISAKDNFNDETEEYEFEV